MKKINMLVVSIVLSFCTEGYAEEVAEPDGLTVLRKEYHEEAMDNVKLINDRYAVALRRKLKTAKNFRKEADAKAIEEELLQLGRDHAYLLKKQVKGISQFAGVWNVDFGGVHRIVSISEKGAGVVQKTILHDGSLKPEWNYSFSIIRDPDHDLYIWEEPWEEKDIQSFEINGKTLVITMLEKGGYPDKEIGKCKGKRIKK